MIQPEQVYRFTTQISSSGQMKIVFQEVKSAVLCLLLKLDQIYIRNKIKFPIKDYFNCLIRLVTPIELMYRQNPGSVKEDFEMLCNIRKKPQVMINQQNSRLRFLSQGQQKKLCDWIQKQFQNGKTITRKIIKQRAKEMSSSKNFKSSQGWCDKFLARNPRIRGLITRIKWRSNRNQQLMDQKPQYNVQNYNINKFEQEYKNQKARQINNQNRYVRFTQNIKNQIYNKAFCYKSFNNSKENQQKDVNQQYQIENQQNNSEQSYKYQESYLQQNEQQSKIYQNQQKNVCINKKTSNLKQNFNKKNANYVYLLDN